MGTTWEYRVLKRTWTDEDRENETRHAVHEVYCDEGETEPNACTKEPVAPGGETLDELRADMARMTAAFDKPVLDYDAIGDGS
jgi:hypothetical protein